MSTVHGKDGVLKIASTAVAESSTWTIEITNEVAEHSVIGRDWRDYTAGQSGFTIEMEGYYDTDDSAQGSLIPGATVAFELYPGGESSGEVQYAGNAVVQTLSNVNANDSMVTFSATLQGTGTLTTASAP